MGQRSTLGGLLVAGLLVGVCVRFFRQGPSEASFVGGVSRSASHRQLKVPRSAVDPALKERIESVKKTGKLTDAMRLVAAAKVRKAQDGVDRSRPFSDELQGMIKGIVKKLKGSGLEAELPMLKVPEKVSNIAILLIQSDRGLCGAYNSFVAKRAGQRIRDLNAQGITPKIFAVGKKAINGLKRKAEGTNYEIVKTIKMPDNIRSSDAAEIADALRAVFLSGEVDKVEIIYAKFFNLLKNDPMVRTILPLSPTDLDDADDETFVMTTEEGKLSAKKVKVPSPKAKEIESDVIFDQAPETILNSMLPLYLTSQILALLFEAQASELSSRMNAMKAATDNAEELGKELLTLYNKKRQAAITQEITEVSVGAMALEDMESKIPPLGMTEEQGSINDEFMQEVEEGSISDVPEAPDGPTERPRLENAFA